MRRALAAGTIGIGLLASGSALASHGASTHGMRDFAIGSGTSEFALGAIGEASFKVRASSDPLGGRAAGYVTSSGDPDGIGPLEPFTAAGRVTCLRVDGNRATLKWRLDKATGSATPFKGGGVQSFVEDNGRTRGGQPLDRAVTDPPQPAASFLPAARQCDDPNARATYDRLEEGDVRVRDAQPRR
jgi:hypothetical protein